MLIYICIYAYAEGKYHASIIYVSYIYVYMLIQSRKLDVHITVPVSSLFSRSIRILCGASRVRCIEAAHSEITAMYMNTYGLPTVDGSEIRLTNWYGKYM